MRNRSKLTSQAVRNCHADGMAKAILRQQQYAEARLVMTQRLHVASPAIALGAPVIWISGKFAAADGPARLGGMDQFFLTNTDAYQLSSWYDLPTMRNRHAWDRVRTGLWAALVWRAPAVAAHVKAALGPPRVLETAETTHCAPRPFVVDVLGSRWDRGKWAVESLLIHHPAACIHVIARDGGDAPPALQPLHDVGYSVAFHAYSIQSGSLGTGMVWPNDHALTRPLTASELEGQSPPPDATQHIKLHPPEYRIPAPSEQQKQLLKICIVCHEVAARLDYGNL